MRASLIATLLLLAPFARAEGERRYETVRCGKDTVVEFDDTRSPDGRFALGWTIRPVAKDAKPVDWSKLDVKGISLVDDYPHNDWTELHENAPYAIVDGIVDLSAKSFKELPVSGTFYTNATHGWNIDVVWLDGKHAIVLVNRRFHTEDAFFVRLASDPLGVTSLLPKMNEQVGKLIREIRPLAPEMDISYGLSEDEETITSRGDTVVDRVPCKVENDVIHMPFAACIPKGSFEDIEGHFLISLRNGNPLKAISGDQADRPFMGALGEADKRLNELYGQLRKLLAGDALKHLVAGQKQWISTRNKEAREFAEEKAPFVNEESTLDAYREARNEQALNLTRERTAVLQKQLDAASSK